MCRDSVLEFCHNFKSKNPSDIQRIFQLFILLTVDRNHNYDEINVRSVLNENEFKTLENGGALSDVPVFKDVPAALLTLTVDTFARFECYDWENHYEEDTDLTAIYECIQALGYEASSEELAYINGTHELYSKSEE